MSKEMAMAKAKKRAAARTKSSKRGAGVKPASKKTAKRATPKQAKPKAQRRGKSVTKPAPEATIEGIAPGVAGPPNPAGAPGTSM
jgi:hypothetical protein